MYMKAKVVVPDGTAASGIVAFFSVLPPSRANEDVAIVNATQHRQHPALVKSNSLRRPRRSTHKAPITATTKEEQLMPRLTLSC